MVSASVGECTTEALFAEGLSSEDQCAMAMENCEAASAFNFYRFYFCTLSGSDLAFYPAGVSRPLVCLKFALNFSSSPLVSPFSYSASPPMSFCRHRCSKSQPRSTFLTHSLELPYWPLVAVLLMCSLRSQQPMGTTSKE